MCVILYVRQGNRPQRSLLDTCKKNNPDGIGFAYFNEDQVEFEKSITIDKLEEYIEKVKDDSNYVIHFRKTSCGTTAPELCHPFPISKGVELYLRGRASRVLFHNGTFKEWKEALLNAAFTRPDFEVPTDKWSDSRAIAKLVNHLGRNFLNVLSFDNENRFLILDAEKKKAEIYGAWWHESYETTTGEAKPDDEGEDTLNTNIWFSNTYWDGSKKK